MTVPDDATLDEIQQIVDQNHAPAGQAAAAPEVPRGQVTGPLRYAGLVGQALARGLVGAAGLPGDLETAGVNYIANPLARLFGGTGDDMADPANHVFPTSQKLMGLVQNGPLASAVGSPGLTPGEGAYPNLERYGTAALSGLVSGGAAGGLGALGDTTLGAVRSPGLAAMAGTGAAGALGSEGAQDLFPNSPLAGTAGGLGAGLVFGGGLKTVQDRAALSGAKRAVAGAEGPAQAATYAAADQRFANRAGAAQRDVDLGQALMDNQSTHDGNVQAALQAQQSADALAQTGLKQTRVSLGGDHTYETAGGVVQPATHGFLTNTVPAMHDGIWAPVDAAVDGATPVPLDGFRDALDRINTAGGRGQPILNTLTSDLPRTLQQRTEALLAPKPLPQGADQVLDGAPPQMGPAPEPLTWDEVRPIRQALGTAIGNPRLSGGAPDGQLRGLYAALSDDMRGAVPAEHAQMFDSANSQAQNLHQLVEGTFGENGLRLQPPGGGPSGRGCGAVPAQHRQGQRDAVAELP